jgi:hypothetical protein
MISQIFFGFGVGGVKLLHVIRRNHCSESFSLNDDEAFWSPEGLLA